MLFLDIGGGLMPRRALSMVWRKKALLREDRLSVIVGSRCDSISLVTVLGGDRLGLSGVLAGVLARLRPENSWVRATAKPCSSLVEHTPNSTVAELVPVRSLVLVRWQVFCGYPGTDSS